MIRDRVFLFLALGCLAGCVDINGGAVELRWEIRKADGNRSNCGEELVDRVRLTATLLGTDTSVQDEWPCVDYRGSTEFTVPPGRYSIVIEPICAGADADVFASVPAPITRDVSNGNVVELNTLLIEKMPEAGVICQARQ